MYNTLVKDGNKMKNTKKVNNGNTCKCGSIAYKLINTTIQGIFKGKLPICYICYCELINE